MKIDGLNLLISQLSSSQSQSVFVIPVRQAIRHQLDTHPAVLAQAVGLRQKRVSPVLLPRPQLNCLTIHGDRQRRRHQDDLKEGQTALCIKLLLTTFGWIGAFHSL